MIARLALAAGLALLALPVMADDAGLSPAQAERRLRACVTSGIDGAPRDSLASSVVAVRALCGHQINDLRRARFAAIERSHPARDAAGRDMLERLKAEEGRRLDTEIAGLVSRLTGLDG